MLLRRTIFDLAYDAMRVLTSPVASTIGWVLHWLLRMALAAYLLIYGGVKVARSQMGELDYSQALTMLGEKSPMGLLWTFMGYSPALEMAAGVMEVLAAFLLLWRRTAWLGGLLAFADMSIVFFLNMTHDVPVKQLSLGMAVAGLIVALPELQRVGKFIVGRPTDTITVPRAVPWPKVDRFTRLFPVLAVVIALVGVNTVVSQNGMEKNDSPLTGVYRIDGEPEGWRHIAFGQHESWYDSGPVTGHVSVRTTDDQLYSGVYDIYGNHLRILLGSPLGDYTAGGIREGVSDERNFTFNGTTLTEDNGTEYLLEPMEQATYLFDREFAWESRTPVNR